MSDPSAATGRRGRVGRAWRAATRGDVDLSVPVGSLTLPNPVMTASGTAGHADELEAYGPLAALGAVVVKSLSVDPWPGNPAPRVHQAGAGMLNSVGLQGPGIEAWARDDLPRLAHAGARTVVSIWGQRVVDYAEAASLLAGVDGPDGGRGQRELSQHRGPAPHVRPLPDGNGRGPVGGGRAPGRRAAVGQAQPHRVRPGRGGRGRARPRRRGGDPGQHRPRHGHRPGAPGPGHSGRGRPVAGCRVRRSTPSPSAPSSTCGPPTPTPPSSASAG